MATHSYNALCRLAPVSQPPMSGWLDGIPPAHAQFFYSSPIPIDDPLSAATTGTDTKGTRGPKPPLRPFSQGDNNALEIAWLALSTPHDRSTHAAALGRDRHLSTEPRSRSGSGSGPDTNERRLSIVVRYLVARHRLKHAAGGTDTDDIAMATVRITMQGAATTIPVCCAHLSTDAANELAAVFCPLTRRCLPMLSVDNVVQRVMVALRKNRPPSAAWDDALPGNRRGSVPAALPIAVPGSLASSMGSRYEMPSARRFDQVPSLPSSLSTPATLLRGPGPEPGPEPGDGPRPSTAAAALPQENPSPATTAVPVPISVIRAADDGISGKPFLRVGTPDMQVSSSVPRDSSAGTTSPARGERDDASSLVAETTPPSPSHPLSGQQPSQENEAVALQAELHETSRLLAAAKVEAEVAVGVSRLHMVHLPSLLMKPIYWSPVHDVSVVQRATWFYCDTLAPLEPAVANQLESLYRELRPWTDAWADETRCAIDIGPEGEEKISQPLWPKPSFHHGTKAVAWRGNAAPAPSAAEPTISGDPFCAARCHLGAAAAEGALPLPPYVHASEDAPDDDAPPTDDSAAGAPVGTRSYANYHVVFKDGTTAFLLKPSLKPSAYYNRRSVSKISKGATVGVPIVRGFDRDGWARMHDKRPQGSAAGVAAATAAAARKPEGSLMADGSDGGPAAGRAGNQAAACLDCPGCQAETKQSQVTDLVLVVHGVGQKLAERVESFHFTHAVNGFRRAVNMELKTPAVRSVLRPDQKGIMVLPVNWRHTLSLDDGGFANGSLAASAAGGKGPGFGLKDIEPSSIPAVRSMISDVMFDIPFYMSHHKPKMIQSMVREANRVYRLWCRNNPEFSEAGRVHLIAHSLGSAMAIDVLSKQPTVLSDPPPQEDAAPGGLPGKVPEGEPPGEPPRDRDVLPSLSQPPPSPPCLPRSDRFEFDTKNLFLLGSPAAFFLLLERGDLLPRRGRQKPGVDPCDDQDSHVVGDAGTFGCLAVDNMYNILAKEDPIAYLLNGTIDTAYAAGLKTAYVPSASLGFFASLGQTLRSVVAPPPPPPPLHGVTTAAASAATATATATATQAATTAADAAAAMLMRLPSQLELEVHDFTREEIAERKAFLLNDNGQIDYILQSGGGPLEIQYLNMLSAHTSYWSNRDLVRMVCVEIGRRPGKAHALATMRAAKVLKSVVPGAN